MSSSEVPDINLTYARSLSSTFSQKLRLIWNGTKQNDSSSQYSWKRRLRWQGGRQKAPISTLSDKEIGGYTLRASPTSSPASHTTYASERRCVHYHGCNFWHQILIFIYSSHCIQLISVELRMKKVPLLIGISLSNYWQLW